MLVVVGQSEWYPVTTVRAAKDWQKDYAISLPAEEVHRYQQAMDDFLRAESRFNRVVEQDKRFIELCKSKNLYLDTAEERAAQRVFDRHDKDFRYHSHVTWAQIHGDEYMASRD